MDCRLGADPEAVVFLHFQVALSVSYRIFGA